jgi:hypothetical protein
MKWEPKNTPSIVESYQAVATAGDKLPHWVFRHGAKYMIRLIEPSGACAVGDCPSFPGYDTLAAAQAAALAHAGKYYVV